MPIKGSILSEVLTAPQPPSEEIGVSEDQLLDFDDYTSARLQLFDKTQIAVQEAFPLENDQYSLSVQDVKYRDPDKYTLSDEKKAVSEGQTLGRRLVGRYVVTDKVTGKVANTSGLRTLINVPYFTQRGTFIRNGTEYAIPKQLRLIPNVYTRHTADGKVESQFNVAPRTGPSFRIQMDPATSLFYMKVSNRKIPLYPVLRKMGVSDEDLKNTWGGGVFKVNQAQRVSPHAINWMRDSIERGEAMLEKQGEENTEPDEQDSAKLRAYFNNMGLDPEATTLTLGKPYSNVTPETLLDSTSKILKVSRGQAETDDRDSLAFQTVHDVSDFLPEKIRHDQNRVMRNYLWKLTGKGGDPSVIPSAALDKHSAHLFNTAKIAQAIEEISPLDIYNQNHRVVRLGEGALPSIESAPREARNVQPSYLNFIDPIRSPESLRIGLDLFFSRQVRKGPKNLLYSKFLDPKSGKLQWVSSRKAANAIIGFPDALKTKDRYVPAMYKSKGIYYVPREKVDMFVHSGDDLLSVGGTTVPLASGIKGMRFLMGSKYPSQSLPLVNREAPNVQSLAKNGQPLYEYLSKFMGVKRAEAAGVVTKVGKESMTIKYDNGETKNVDLYNTFPFSRKTFMHNYPTVKLGDRVEKDGLLATSNFSTDTGTGAPGRNLRVAYMGYRGKNFEDATVISEEAAKKLTSEQMYVEKKEEQEGLRFSKNTFRNLFPTKFKKDQLENIGDNGIVKPGTVLNYGDPMILASKERIPSLSTLGRRVSTDESKVWEHYSPGVVTSVSKTKKGHSVFVRSNSPMQVGDKLALPWGAKGIISEIVKQEDMPRDAQGKALEVLLSPLGIISRTNSAQLVAAALGKVAAKTGKPYVLPGFMNENMVDFAMKELADNGLTDTEELYDPLLKKSIPKVFVGNTYVYKLQQIAESKGKARSTGSYSQDEDPSRGGKSGSKHVGSLDLQALLSHGATEVIKDLKLIKGQKNDDFWRQVKLGKTPVSPKSTFVYDKFKALLRSGGINLQETSTADSIYGMTNTQMVKLSGNRQIKTGQTFSAKHLKPIPGGLFDPQATGSLAGGDRFSYIQLPDPLPNPMMENALRVILSKTQKEFDEVLEGGLSVDGKTGGQAMKALLDKVSLPQLKAQAENEIRFGSASRKDAAVKRFGFLTAMEKHGVKPSDFMMDRVLVLPPKYRPVTRQGGLTMSNDMNYMYKALTEAIEDYNDSEGLPEPVRKEARSNLVNIHRATIGMIDPAHPKLVQKNIGGILKQLFGKGSPKASFVQRKVMETNMDISGLAVVSPNPNLKLNEVGLPIEKAWELYEPWIIRHMVRNNTPATAAAKAVKNKDRSALAALQEVVKQRPVIVNRAPTLHKYSMMAFKPKLVKGETLQVSPAIVGPFTMDFDGDSISGCVAVSYDFFIDNIEKTVEKSKGDSIVVNTKKEANMPISKTAKLSTNVSIIPIENMPRIEASKIEKSDNVSEWDVPLGVNVCALDRETRELKHYAVTKFSEHRNLKMFDVTLGKWYSKVITVSEDHSLVGYVDGVLELLKPEEALHKMVPVSKALQHYSSEDTIYNMSNGEVDIYLNKESGIVLGALIGDGWVDVGNTCYLTSAYPEFIDYIEGCLIQGAIPLHNKDKVLSSHYYDRKNIEGVVKPVNKTTFSLTAKAKELIGQKIGKGFDKKVIPQECLRAQRSHLIGLLIGLMSTDGSIFCKKGLKRNKEFWNCGASYCTLSTNLRDSFVHLCKLLGIRTTVSMFITKLKGNTGYTITLCKPDFVKFCRENEAFHMPIAHKQDALELFLSKVDMESNTALAVDKVPYPKNLHSVFLQLNKQGTPVLSPSGLSKVNKDGFISRIKALEFSKKHLQDLPEDTVHSFKEWRTLVKDTEVNWERVENVSKREGLETAYDITVPGPFTFATSDGIIVQDTASYSVPVSKAAVKEAMEKMLPEKNLLSVRNDLPHYVPSQEYIQGLYYSTKEPTNKKPVIFLTRADAMAAYKSGEIRVDDPIIIKGE